MRGRNSDNAVIHSILLVVASVHSLPVKGDYQILLQFYNRKFVFFVHKLIEINGMSSFIAFAVHVLVLHSNGRAIASKIRQSKRAS